MLYDSAGVADIDHDDAVPRTHVSGCRCHAPLFFGFLPSPPGCLVLSAPVRSTAARTDGTLDP